MSFYHRVAAPLAFVFVTLLALDAAAATLYLTYNGDRSRSRDNALPVGQRGVMPVGDLNGDGFTDLGVSVGSTGNQEDWYGCGWRIHLGGPEPTAIPDATLSYSFHDGGTLHAPGDLNGDDFDDLARRTGYSYGDIKLHAGSQELTAFHEYTMYLADDRDGFAREYLGDQIAVGDFNADGVMDFIAGDQRVWGGEPGHVFIFELTDEAWDLGAAIPTTRIDGLLGDTEFAGNLVSLGDYDGNGIPDLLVNLWDGIPSVVYGGPEFDFESAVPATGYLLGMAIGDLNGDELTDFYHEGNIYFGGGSFAKAPDVVSPQIVSFENSLGDFNGDGFKDMVAAEPQGDGYLVQLLFGGPEMDAFIDASFHHDGGMACWPIGSRRWNENGPLPFNRPPNCVASAGDMDHDGLDDIAIVDWTVVHPDDVEPLDGPMGQVWIYTDILEAVPVLQVTLNASPSARGVSLNWTVPDGIAVNRLEIWRRTGSEESTMIRAWESDQIAASRSFLDAELSGGFSWYKIRVDMGGSVVESNEAVVAGTPSRTQSLSISAHPNPFNPQTQIRYSVPEAGHVRIAIYDMAGRLVKTLLNERQTRGARDMIWNGQDDAGARVASGAYNVVIESRGQRGHVRIALLK